MMQRIVGVGSIDDLPEQHQRRIAREPIFLHDRFERALLAMMAELHVLHVVRSSAEAFRLVHDLVGWNENELRILVHELLYKPWTSDAIDLDVLASDPLHEAAP